MEDVMLAQYFKSPSHVQLLLSRPGGPLLEEFSKSLKHFGYARSSGYAHLTAASHFLCWADQEGIPRPFGEIALAGFSAHLAQCQCREFSHLRGVGALRGARRFLMHQGGIRPRPTGFAALESSLESGLFPAFCQWMRLQRGTRDITLCLQGNALRNLFEHIGNDANQLDARYLRQFVLEQSKKTGWAAAKLCTTALRNLVRFLIAEGKCPAALIDAIPKLAHWRLSALPQYLHMDDVERIIASCDAATSCGQRDRAIILLLARLGLRAGDICQLRIGDIDWKGATIALTGKNGRETLLPLTQEVGQAIVDYLQHGRSDTNTDTVFIRKCAPFQAFSHPAAVSTIVKNAMRRAGVVCPGRGAAHVLRHSVATSMLGQGASLQDIAAVLRHQSIATTQIYAKVDIAALRQVVQPWPEQLPC
jgi:site-specific recombinase XerD